MDNYFINDVLERCPVLRFRFAGVWSADNFPVLKKATFIVVNASKQFDVGTHWLLLVCTSEDAVTFWDSLGNGLETYSDIYLRCITIYGTVQQLSCPVQGKTSNLCGAYCIFMAHEIFTGQNILGKWYTSNEVVEFVNNHCKRNQLLKFKVI